VVARRSRNDESSQIPRSYKPVGMNRSGETILQVNGVALCAETFGDPADPALLLIGGSSSSMDWWEDGFCERLAAGRRFVIRFDHRDTGRSVAYPPGAPGYGSDDLIADAVGVLDALDTATAHVVGISMGGAIAQLVALDHPARVASLPLISPSPGAPGPDDPDLPTMSEETIAEFAVDEPDWSDRDAVIDYLLHLARVSASPSRPFEEAEFRDLAGRVFDRTTNIESSMKNHEILDGGDRWRERLAGLSVPTLVIHGTDDPVLPYGNALALAREIPGARLVTLEGTGHELPRASWDVVVPAILEHTAG
jgi:pimeloyl-ACP methyl ester carboxylesterase